MIRKENLFTSAWEFHSDEADLKNKFQMINIAILLSSIGLVVGISANLINNILYFIPLELAMVCVNFFLFFLIRYKKKFLNLAAVVETGQFTILFLLLIYFSDPMQLKHIWIFTYPIVLLYFHNEKYSLYWVLFMISMILIAPIQTFVIVQYTQFQVVFISIVLAIISVIVYFYQIKMEESKDLIKSQINELKNKDKLLSLQSKQAVMGEMISMIAHQWRQPLSTVTLSISDLQLKKMLGKNIDDEYMNKALQDISDTILYLSDTIDDFQTYFAPNKSLSEEDICEIIHRSVNFSTARMYSSNISFKFEECGKGLIQTYSNELVQVVLNILNNAIDELIQNNKNDPSISIKVVDMNTSYNIYIKDNGRGIALENIESIFEPYYSTKGKNGTGLGLYMSQMIMQKQFNSKIGVQSSQAGTEFCIQVPKKLV